MLTEPQELHDGATLHESFAAEMRAKRPTCAAGELLLGGPSRRSATTSRCQHCVRPEGVWETPDIAKHLYCHRHCAAQGRPFATGSRCNTCTLQPHSRPSRTASPACRFPPSAPPSGRPGAPRVLSLRERDTCRRSSGSRRPHSCTLHCSLHNRRAFNVAQWTSPTATMASRTIRPQRLRGSSPPTCPPR